jgi:TonB family protein
VRVPPDYPSMAASAQMEGRVILEATVDEKGNVDDVRVLRSHAIFDEAAVDALKQWRYEPLVFNGRPTPFVLTVTLSFNLNAR